ncbi:unnamed protein product [Caenorhabditis angaria]|uniref:Uncharacterized protein n=1 Tax=Caenorhabditis angaria TaxID=860376 RepID=A0A9P1N5Z1_9PELO|nr:unnamed protein product [Caenorhabditis angaria]
MTSPDIDEKLNLLHREMASLRVECDRLLNKHLIVEHTLTQSCSGCGAADTSSAYNTGGESCRSVSVTPDAAFLPTQPSPRALHRTLKIASPAASRKPPIQIPRAPPTVILPHEVAPRPIHRTAQPQSSTSTIVFRPPSSVFGALKGSTIHKLAISNKMSKSVLKNGGEQKNGGNLNAEECAKRFRIPSYSVVLKAENNHKRASFMGPITQYFRSKSKRAPTSTAVLGGDELEEVVDEEKMAAKTDLQDTTVHYKWKVKLRCDGSRYIVKRPIRSQILKKREAQLYRERAPISTDDDAMSELKLGRFHTKDERKRILEREKMKKMLKLQQKMSEKGHPSEQVILQMSQQKMAQQKDNILQDEFATTREVLSARTRPDGIRGVVSVTTV